MKKNRGFGIVVERGKTWENLGGIIRSAGCFGAAFVATVGGRYRAQVTDTARSDKTIPVFSFIDWEDYRIHAPFAWTPVAVELVEGAEVLGGIDSKTRLQVEFEHPKQAVYFIGPEDGNLTKKAQEMAKHKVIIPTNGCLNQCVAASIVMYDRLRQMGSMMK